MGGLLHLVQGEGDWAGLQAAQAPPRCTKYIGPPINGQCTNHRTTVFNGPDCRAYSKRAVQPICAVQDAICAVQNEKLCSPKTQS